MNKNTIKNLMQLKNASMARLEKISIKNNFLILKLVQLFYKEGFIQSFKISLKEDKLLIYLRYFMGKPTLSTLKFVSSSNKYISYLDLCKLSKNANLLVLSTNQGYLTSTECKKHRLGGKICFIC